MSAPIDLTPHLLRAWSLPQMVGDEDKEARGELLIIAGSCEVPGAAILAARAALRAGAGKVAIATDEAVALPIGIAVPECLVIGLAAKPDGKFDDRSVNALVARVNAADAVLIGPGMLDEPATVDLVCQLLERCANVPMVLDAGALAAGNTPRAAGRNILLTPHGGEMAKLCDTSKASIQACPVEAAIHAARRWKVAVALKGAETIIVSPEGEAWRHAGDVPGLATAGSGDVLAGVIAGLASRGASLLQAAAWGVCLHGEAGRRLSRKIGSVGFLASEIALEIPPLLDEWCES